MGGEPSTAPPSPPVTPPGQQIFARSHSHHTRLPTGARACIYVRFCVVIQVLGSHYQPELLAVIAPENLPTQFGGTSTCTELVDVGPWQDPAVIAACPALRKAAAAGQLDAAGAPGGVVVADSSGSPSRTGSFIGTGVVLGAGDSSSSSMSGEEGSQGSS